MTRKRFWPDPTQKWLLGVCLQREPATAIQSWKKWKARVNLNDLDETSFQIMSLVYSRLIALRIADPDLRRIKGIHRYQWTQNQLAGRAKRALLHALQRENIPTLLLQGAALGQTVYPEPVTRGLHDMDIVVPAETAAHAVNQLGTHGWKADCFDGARTIECSPACALLHPDYGATHLRWQIMPSHCQIGHEEEFWRAARAFEYERIATRILCPADQFLSACESGTHPTSDSGLQWLVDGAFVIRHSPPPFDWSRLIDLANKFYLVLPTYRTLLYLKRHFEDSIPREVLAELARAPVTLDQRIEYFLAGRPAAKQQDLTHKFGFAICRYRNLKQGARLRQFLHDFPRFLRLLVNRVRE